jgi:hypothetical protein
MMRCAPVASEWVRVVVAHSARLWPHR